MAPTRTISVVAAPVVPAGVRDVPAFWIVEVDGHEFVHGGEHARTFGSREDAAQFASDLLRDSDRETRIELVGLDDLGVPLPGPVEVPVAIHTFEDWLDETGLQRPAVVQPLDRVLSLFCKALTDASALARVNLILAVYKPYLRPQDAPALRRLDSAFVIARLKRELPAEFVRFAALDAAFGKAVQ